MLKAPSMSSAHRWWSTMLGQTLWRETVLVFSLSQSRCVFCLHDRQHWAPLNHITWIIQGFSNFTICFSSFQGIIERDEIVFRKVTHRQVPIVMLTSGGYQRSTAAVIADSIWNLSKKSLINMWSLQGGLQFFYRNIVYVSVCLWMSVSPHRWTHDSYWHAGPINPSA